MHGCDIRSESTRTIAGRSGLHPDILITADDRAPVVIEAEFMPAPEVERDAEERLRLEVAGGRREIEAAIALRYPAGLEDAYDLAAELTHAQLSYCVLTTLGENDEQYERFPDSGWLEGSAEDVAELARLVSVPQSAVDAAADAFQRGIDDGAALLKGVSESRPAISQAIAALLGMKDVRQTHKMACAIVANAMLFHDRVAGMHEGVNTLRLVCGPNVLNPQERIIESWTHILDNINYWPIFAIARDIIEQLATREASQLIRVLHYAAGDVAASGANVEHDLTGRVFQRLIADRKYLATFYTLPASAALLARLAVEKLDGVDWSHADDIGRLRVGDFACGTGALLSAVYEQFATRHEQAGGNPASLHKMMMEDVLYGCDVMPSAIHITSSTLSGREPNVGFGGSRLYNMPYGRQQDGTVAIGSLELLQSSAVMTLFNTNDPAMRTGSTGEETAARVIVDVQDEGFDIVIMNPPFTSNTKHYDADEGVLNAAFAAFNAPKAEQDNMASRMKELSRNTCYHGHAGLGSAFAALADRKVRPGGVIAFVLPLTAINGSSWSKFRELITKWYTDLTIVSIAANGKDMSFSSDTGIAECLIIGRKLRDKEKSGLRADFVSLRRRPGEFIHALELSKGISHSAEIRRIEDGPYGGMPVFCGEELEGEAMAAPVDGYRSGWGAARLLDASVAQTAHALSNGKLWLPTQLNALALPIVQLKDIGHRGHDHQMFISVAHKGPFSKSSASPTATYPALWNHNARNEKRVVCPPDSQMLVKRGMEERANEFWASASRSHINADFTFGSQPLAVAFTERESIGGRIWPNVIFEDKRFDYAFTIWGNSTLGLLSHWWHSSRQQSSKGGHYDTESRNSAHPQLPHTQR